MNPELYRPQPGKYEKPKGTPAGEGWIKIGKYYERALSTGGVQKLSEEEWEKKHKYAGLRETVSQGLAAKAQEEQRVARERQRDEALRSLYEDLAKIEKERKFKEMGGAGKNTSH